MNKDTIMASVGVIAIVIIGGLVLYGARNNATLTANNTIPVVDVTANDLRQPGIPTAITHPQAYPTDTTAIVTGTVNPNGSFTSYWYEYGFTPNLGTKTANQSVGSGYALIGAPAYITSLAKNTTYYFHLVSDNQYGRVVGAQYSFKTTEGNPPIMGVVPTIKTMAANGISRTTANLNGQLNPKQSITQYWFEYGKTTDLGNVTILASIGDGSMLINAGASPSNLEANTTYYFRLNAQNQFGTVNGTILNFKTSGPSAATVPAVTTRAATTIEATTATLHATITPNNAETTYWFEYGTDSSMKTSSLKTTAKKSAGAAIGPVTVEVLTNVVSLRVSTTYYFRAVAQNSQGLVRGAVQDFKTK